jgi:carboxyl-terminal processing protease
VEQIDQSTDNTTQRSNKLKRLSLFLAAAVIFSLGWAVGDGRISLNTTKDVADQVANNAPANLSTDGLQEIYDKLKLNYDGDIEPEKLLDGLKKGAVAAVGDTYTEYLSPEETKDFNSDLNGSFEGIGAELGKEGNFVVIVAPIKGAPAEKAGIQPQDIIIEIDGESATDITVSEAVKRIRGEKGTEVKLKLIRDGQQVEVAIVRDTITIDSVEWKVENNVGFLTISRFGDDTVSLAQKAARDFKSKGVSKVILDMRGNPGGLLDAAVGVANIWLPDGSTILEEKRGGETIKTFTATTKPILDGVKTVVLINEGSASASEIVAGALRDNRVATLIGEKSYGKGSVQQLINLENGGSLKVTIARWYTPAGKNIDKEGIEPDTKVDRTPEDIKSNRDPQLDAAKSAL